MLHNYCNSWNRFSDRYLEYKFIKFDMLEEVIKEFEEVCPPFYRMFLHVVDFSMVRDISLTSLREMEAVHVE